MNQPLLHPAHRSFLRLVHTLQSLRGASRLLACAALCVGWYLAGATAVLAQPVISKPAPYTEVQRLLQAGQYPQALAQADAWLTEQATDPQMRFLKGVIHNRMGNDVQARDTFTRLTQDYPELPEPYNNLAVLHAQQNRLDEARAALEMAIRLNPAYAVAHQNLGDVYARMAAQSYARALQLSPDNTTLQPKLKALESAVGTPR